MKHLVMDMATGRLVVRARDGKDYAWDELAEIERRAQEGDADAAALLESMELPDPGAAGYVDLHQLVHDCPECREAMARGERPTFHRMPPRANRSSLRRKPTLRWRQQKQGRRS